MSRKALDLGDRVRIPKRVTRWYLDHQDIYQRPDGSYDNMYDIEMQLWILHQWGEPMTAVITGFGAPDETDPERRANLRVQIKCGKLKASLYMARKEVRRASR